MNKKGVTIIIRWMVAVFLLGLTFGYLGPWKDTITLNRDSNHLDCANTSISDGTKITCLGLDMILWLFIFVIIVRGFGVVWDSKTNQ